jgi:hypothetical protein
MVNVEQLSESLKLSLGAVLESIARAEAKSKPVSVARPFTLTSKA